LGDRRAVETLIEVARNHHGFFVPMVRHAAVLALGKLGGPAAQAVLQEIANDSFEISAFRDAARQASI
jgi:HEAT repeat protein